MGSAICTLEFGKYLICKKKKSRIGGGSREIAGREKGRK